MTSLKLTYGRDVTMTWNFTSNGVPVDMSGNTFYFTIKQTLDEDNTDASAILTKEDTDFTISTGQVSVVLSADDLKLALGTYFFDLNYIDTSSNKIYVNGGKMSIVNVVGRRV